MLKWTSSNKLYEKHNPSLTTSIEIQQEDKPRLRCSTGKSSNTERGVTVLGLSQTSHRENIMKSTRTEKNKNCKQSLNCTNFISTPLNENTQGSKKFNSCAINNFEETPRIFKREVYASTLPKYEEEYSPNNLMIPSGQIIAMRGLLPDTFLANKRYLNTTLLTPQQNIFIDDNILTKENLHSNDNNKSSSTGYRIKSKAINRYNSVQFRMSRFRKSFLQKRKLNFELNEDSVVSEKNQNYTITDDRKLINDKIKEYKTLIRKSTNLRRRRQPLNYNQINGDDCELSPSYTPAEDPANDLSFSENKKREISRILHSQSKNNNYTNVPINNNKFECSETNINNNYIQVGVASPSIYI